MFLRLQVVLVVAVALASEGLARRVDLRDERGEVTSTTIMIAVLASLAIVVGAIIVTKVTGKANSIPTD